MKLAVVVQCMVGPEAAGVMFTANPVTGARDEVVVDASPGLGEAVVSGLVTPDHFVLRKRRWRWSIAERWPGRREVITRARSGGGTEQVEGTVPTATSIPALPDRALHQLAQLGTAIQRHFGSPQDAEWAWADGRLFILQARPITALPSPPPRANRLQRLIASNFGELFSIRPYPLDMDAWIPAPAGALEPVFGFLALDFDELARMGDELPPPSDLATELRASMMRRKKERARLEGTPLVDPRLFFQNAAEDGALLHGMPGSPAASILVQQLVQQGLA